MENMNQDMRNLLRYRCMEVFICNIIFGFSMGYIHIYQARHLSVDDFALLDIVIAVLGTLAYQMTTKAAILEWAKRNCIRLYALLNCICIVAILLIEISPISSLLVNGIASGFFMRLSGMASEDYYNTIFQDKERTYLTTRTRQIALASAIVTGTAVLILKELPIRVIVIYEVIGLIIDTCIVTIMITKVRQYINKYGLRK